MSCKQELEVALQMLDEERKYSSALSNTLIAMIEPHAAALGLTGTWHVADGVKALITHFERHNKQED